MKMKPTGNTKESRHRYRARIEDMCTIYISLSLSVVAYSPCVTGSCDVTQSAMRATGNLVGTASSGNGAGVVDGKLCKLGLFPE